MMCEARLCGWPEQLYLFCAYGDATVVKDNAANHSIDVVSDSIGDIIRSRSGNGGRVFLNEIASRISFVRFGRVYASVGCIGIVEQ